MPTAARFAVRGLMRTQRGFTLIELLVVVSIIGILALLAIPLFNSYRVRAFNARAQSNLHDAVTAQEAFHGDYERYGDCMNAGCEAALPGFKLSAGVSVACTPRDADTHYRCSAVHPQGDRSFYYDSEFSAFWEM